MKNRFAVPAIVAVATLAFVGCSAGPRASTSSTTSTTGAPTTTVAASPTTLPPAPGSFAAIRATCAPEDLPGFDQIVAQLSRPPAPEEGPEQFKVELTAYYIVEPVVGYTVGAAPESSCLHWLRGDPLPTAPQGGGTGHGSGSTGSHGSGSGGTGTGTPAPVATTPSTPAPSTPLPVIPPASTDAPVYTVPPTPSTPPTPVPVTTAVPAPTPTDPPAATTTTAFTGTVVCDETGCHTEG